MGREAAAIADQKMESGEYIYMSGCPPSEVSSNERESTVSCGTDEVIRNLAIASIEGMQEGHRILISWPQ